MAVLLVAYAIFGVTWAIGGDDAISDTVVAYVAGLSLLGGLLAALVAFTLAVVAKVRHERWTLLWFPLSVFPTLVVLVVLVEMLWME